MPSVIENKKTKEKCQIFTPNNIATRMLDLSEYTEIKGEISSNNS